MGVRKLVSDDQWAFGNGYKGAQSALEVTLVLGSASVALGAGLNNVYSQLCSHSKMSPLFYHACTVRPPYSPPFGWALLTPRTMRNDIKMTVVILSHQILR